MKTRREFLRTSGLLVASVGALSLSDADIFSLAAQGAGPYADKDFLQLDSWIVIRPDNTVYYLSVQSMPFVRPNFAEMVQALDFVIKNDYPARGEHVGPVAAQRAPERYQ